MFAVKAERQDAQRVQSQIIEDLLRYVNPTQHPVLVQILLNKRKLFVKTKQQQASHAEKNRALTQVLQSTQLSKVEHSGKRLLQEIGGGDASTLVKSLSINLRATDIKPDADSPVIAVTKQGLLVDWLAEADSEMIRSNEELQLDLLFSRTQRSFRPYLLSLLSHQSSWITMAKVIEKLLSKYNPNFDPGCVLDFIEALIRNPKLWQGRDRAVPKHEQAEYILELGEEQVKAMTQYILNDDPAKLSTRVHLLLHATDPKMIHLMRLIQFVDAGKIGNLI